MRCRSFPDTVAACQGGRLVVHFTNRKNAPFLFFHQNRDPTEQRAQASLSDRDDVRRIYSPGPMEPGAEGMLNRWRIARAPSVVRGCRGPE